MPSATNRDAVSDGGSPRPADCQMEAPIFSHTPLDIRSVKGQRGGESCRSRTRETRVWLVAVVFRLERALRRHADIVGLFVRKLGQLRTQLAEVQPSDFLVEMLGQRVDLVFVLLGVGPQLDLRQ